jgi:hypothetical protein
MDFTFFSFITLRNADAAGHRSYNEWHQLDHRPENLALPGVAWGDRWARPPGYRSQSDVSTNLSEVDYVAMYWFRKPVEDALATWDTLGELSFQWGRGPLLPGVERPLLGFFTPVKGYAAPSALVSPAAIPYRPNRGLHLTLTRFPDPHSPGVHELFRWQDRVLTPAELELPGVAGIWAFSFDHYQRHKSLDVGTKGNDQVGSLRIRLMYLDDDPLDTTARIIDLNERLRSAPDCDQQVLLATPLKTIIPWQDW